MEELKGGVDGVQGVLKELGVRVGHGRGLGEPNIRQRETKNGHIEAAAERRCSSLPTRSSSRSAGLGRSVAGREERSEVRRTVDIHT